MTRVLAIADDFTGAAEIAAAGLRCGLPSRVVRVSASGEFAGLTVIDTDSRLLPPEEAAAAVEYALGGIDASVYGMVYKKTDSVLRGPVAAELMSALKSLGRSKALLAPQNPSRGRTIEGGRYSINGVPLELTTFADDPHYPRKTSDAVELAEWSAPGTVSHKEAVAYQAAERTTPITIVGGRHHLELERWARAADDQTLLAGGVDFFLAALEGKGIHQAAMVRPNWKPGPVLMVCGSRAQASGEFRATLHAANPQSLALGDIHAAAAAVDYEVARWVDAAVRSLQKTGFVALAFDNPDLVVGSQPAGMMAEVVWHVLERTKVRYVWIEGGSTASAVFDRAGWNFFEVLGEFSPGVAALRPIERPDLGVVVKPGSYMWPKSAGDCLPEQCQAALRHI